MIRNALIFLLLAFLAGLVGFGNPASPLASYAEGLFWIGLAASLSTVFGSLWGELRELSRSAPQSDFQR